MMDNLLLMVCNSFINSVNQFVLLISGLNWTLSSQKSGFERCIAEPDSEPLGKFINSSFKPERSFKSFKNCGVTLKDQEVTFIF